MKPEVNSSEGESTSVEGATTDTWNPQLMATCWLRCSALCKHEMTLQWQDCCSDYFGRYFYGTCHRRINGTSTFAGRSNYTESCSTVTRSCQNTLYIADVKRYLMLSRALAVVAMATDPMTSKQTRHHASHVSYSNRQLCILTLCGPTSSWHGSAHRTDVSSTWLHVKEAVNYSPIPVSSAIQISEFLRPLCIALLSLTSKQQLNVNCTWQQ